MRAFVHELLPTRTMRNDALFAGPIPVELSKLKAIVEINLANNRLSGEMPV